MSDTTVHERRPFLCWQRVVGIVLTAVAAGALALSLAWEFCR